MTVATELAAWSSRDVCVSLCYQDNDSSLSAVASWGSCDNDEEWSKMVSASAQEAVAGAPSTLIHFLAFSNYNYSLYRTSNFRNILFMENTRERERERERETEKEREKDKE